ncbi:hypothetical protein YSA_04075 [Pseudomonas putida ND6]|uniref:Uncharacterized protein n=1 Tax=Pseudomonas putida ND6 TaxID=231023 RepID=I3UU03_PSEPU|nr:hypothetical protein YSA_04075 [Pseudomonas putida ND6]
MGRVPVVMLMASFFVGAALCREGGAKRPQAVIATA